MISLAEYTNHCLLLASNLNVNAMTSRTIYTMGANLANEVVYRPIILSYNLADLPIDKVITLWFDISSRYFFKSTNWKEPVARWERVTEYLDLFDESTLDSNLNVTGPLFLVRNPVENSEAVTKIYVDTLISAITNTSVSGINNNYGSPVPSVIELRLVDVSLVPDKQIRLVESVNRIYSYDLESNSPVDNEWIVAPFSGPGRWISTEKKILDSGLF